MLALFEPHGVAVVKLGTGCLGHCVVCGVAQEEVAEPEAIVARYHRCVGQDQALADEAREVRGDRGVLGGERVDGASVEDLPLARRRAQYRAPWVELVEPRGEERLQRGWDDDVALAPPGDHEHLGDEQRVAAGGGTDLLAERGRELVRRRSSTSCR